MNFPLRDGTWIRSASFMTDVTGDGSLNLGVEHSITSKEDRSDDDDISDYEQKFKENLLAAHPFLQEEWSEWDREGGETEWTSKAMYSFAPPKLVK